MVSKDSKVCKWEQETSEWTHIGSDSTALKVSHKGVVSWQQDGKVQQWTGIGQEWI